MLQTTMPQTDITFEVAAAIKAITA
jgi:hypothetical protein